MASYKPQREPKPVPDIPQSRLNFPFIRFARCFARPIQHLFGFRKISVLHPERLVSLYKDFQEKKTKLVLGFRHPYGNDPQLMVFLLHCVLPKLAKKQKVKLNGFPHAHFIYGAEVPLWSGAVIRNLLPQVGGLPVNHLKPDAKGINAIRKTITQGAYPAALAPEGHVNYDSLHAAPLETGTARFCFWAAEDLTRAGETADVVLLPVSQHYLYADSLYAGKKKKDKLDAAVWKKLFRILKKIEKQCGISSQKENPQEIPRKINRHDAAQRNAIETVFRRRLSRLDFQIRKTFTESLLNTRVKDDSEIKNARELAEQVISRAEGILGIQNQNADGAGDFRTRLYTARTEAWNRLLSASFRSLPPLGESLEARKAGEAWYAMRYIETAELLQHIAPDAIPQNAPVSIFAEKLENAADLLERAKGGTLKNRPHFFPVYPLVILGEPISVRDNLPLYKENKKQAVETLTEKLAEAYKTLAQEFLNTEADDSISN